MYKLKRELGSEAVILHTRKIKKSGFLGFFKKPLFEVVAAIDDERELNNVSYKNKSIEKAPKMKSELFKNTSNQQNEINSEIKKLREKMEDFIENFDTKTNESRKLPNKLCNLHELLVKNGVEDFIANNILDDLNQRVNISNKDEYALKEILKYDIQVYLGEPSSIMMNNKQRIIFFIGPTGVGKTTTLAKIAAQYALEHPNKLGLITADTYRIGAVEQLKIYSEILHVPLKIIYDTKEIYSALSKFKDKEVIMIDTAGRNHRDNEMIGQIKQMIETVNNKEIYLVLSATTNYQTIQSIIKQYSFIDDYKIIFTKIDEADNLGIILNTKFFSKKRLSYITTGQKVPEDIEIANVDKITKILTGELQHERSS